MNFDSHLTVKFETFHKMSNMGLVTTALFVIAKSEPDGTPFTKGLQPFFFALADGFLSYCPSGKNNKLHQTGSIFGLLLCNNSKRIRKDDNVRKTTVPKRIS